LLFDKETKQNKVFVATNKSPAVVLPNLTNQYYKKGDNSNFYRDAFTIKMNYC